MSLFILHLGLYVRLLTKLKGFGLCHTRTIRVKGKVIPVQAYYRPLGFQEVEAPRFLVSRYMKVVSPTHRLPLPSRKFSRYSFLLEVESAPAPQCGWKDYVNEKFQ